MSEKMQTQVDQHGQPLESSESNRSSTGHANATYIGETHEAEPKKSFGRRTWDYFLMPGSALQIVLAAVIAIAIGMAVNATVDDIPEAAPAILEIPGDLWLRALRATVLPLIVCAIILAVQNLKSMAEGGSKLALYTVSWYVCTTIIAIVQSVIIVDVGWKGLMQVVSEEELSDTNDAQADIEESSEEAGQQAHDIVVQVAQSFIPNNIVAALAEDSLLAVLVSAIVVGCLIKGPKENSPLLRAITEIEKIIFTVISFLIKLAPIGVFFLILANLMTLDMASVGQNLGVLIGASVSHMFVQLFIVIPILFFGFTRCNPYSFWLKNSPAWITAWGSASSAATLPVTLKCMDDRGIPKTVSRFTAPLGALINMDGTAIYFPVVVVFMAATQGQALNAGDYVIIVLLATLSSIATTPIPSSSLVLTIMICNSVGIEITGMYGVVIAIDWFIDRFRTATNVSGDMFCTKVMAHLTGITDDDVAKVGGEQAALDNIMGKDMRQAGDANAGGRDIERV